MMNSTALVFATNHDKKDLMVNHLAATGLFGQVKTLKSSAALFRHLKSKSADMICWAIEEKEHQHDWIGKLQSFEQWHDLPLIAFAEDQQSMIDGFQMGASDAVHVEIETPELSARINRHLERWQRLLELRKSQEQLQKMALTDPLTQLGNRATFDMSIRQAAARSQRTGTPCSLLMIDLDHFKNFNDTHGHQVGDTILQLTGQAIQIAARDSDICCRYGGEEFAVILPDTKAQNAEVLAKRIHQQMKKVSQSQPLQRQPITVSIGVSSTSSRNGASPKKLIEEADQALYLAKDNGRNRTERWHPDFTLPRTQFTFNSPHQMAFGA